MAPANHSCSDTPPSTNVAAVRQANTEDCRGGDKLRTHRGIQHPRTIKLLAVTLPEASPRRATNPTVKSRAESLAKEPAFVAAIVLTVFVLLGGVIVTKLSNTRLPRRRSRTIGNGSISPAMRSSRAGQGATSPLVVAFPQVAGRDRGRYPIDASAYMTPTSPFSPSPTPGLPIDALVQDRLEEPATQPDVYLHEGRSLPQIVLSGPHETFPAIEALAVCDEVVVCPISKAIEERAQAVVDMFPEPDASPSSSPSHDSWSRLRQDSEASDHSTEETGPVDLFSSGSSLSSLTSASGPRSDSGELDDDLDFGGGSDIEMAFEVKRGQTQSLELAKGRLMSWPALPWTSSSTESVEGEKAVDQEVVEEQDLSKFPRRRTLSRPPIPALIITEPSTLSLFTVTSSTSNLSIDLSQFPVPPLDLEPAAFWQKLGDEMDSSLALKQRRSSRIVG